MPLMSDYYVDLETLKKIGGEEDLHKLDSLALLPFQPVARTNAGRRFRHIIIDTIDQMLSETDRFTRIADHLFLFYLGPNRKLAAMKLDLIRKEISRRIDDFIQEKYFPTPLLEPNDPPGLGAEKPPVEKWKPPVEELPARTKPDSPEKINLANQAIIGMLKAREGKRPLIARLRESNPLTVLYNPVWNVPKNHLTAFIATAAGMPQDSAQLSYLKERARYDLALFLRATADLNQLLSENGRVVLIIPVSLATLDSYPFRHLYLQCCAALPAAARNLVVLKLEQIDRDITSHGLDDILREPASLIRTIILSSTLQNKNFNSPTRTPIHGYSITLSPETTNEQKLFPQLDRFANILESQQKASLIENIHKTSLLCAAIGAGASYVSGPAILPPQPTLTHIAPFDLVRAYEKYYSLLEDFLPLPPSD